MVARFYMPSGDIENYHKSGNNYYDGQKLDHIL